MKNAVRLALLAAVVMSTSLALAADVPVNPDRAQRLAELQRTRDAFLASVSGLTEAQWNFKPAPDRWSIAECAEHITAAESLIRGLVEKTLAQPAPETAEPANHDEKILKLVVDRSSKFKAPEPLIPTQRYESPAATLAEFEKQRAQTIALAGGSGEFRLLTSQNPVFGRLDAHGWILFLSAHSERHTRQIEEVKASEGYPK